MIAGFETPTSGDIFVDSSRINDQPPDKRDSAMVFQSYALFPHLSVFNNVAFGLELKQLASAVIAEKVNASLRMVGLEGLENRQPNQLSGGQQQRVALARALVMEPSVLLFDEPLSNLDAKLRVHMRREIRQIQRQLGLTSVYVTHDQAEAMSLSDQVIVMNHGKIEQIGEPAEVYQKPASEFVADFIGVANFLDAEVVAVEADRTVVRLFEKTFFVPGRRNDLQQDESVRLVIRPETVRLGREGVFGATVTYSTYMGPSQEYVIDLGGCRLQVEQSDPVGKERFAENSPVMVSFREESLHIVKKLISVGSQTDAQPETSVCI
jgi:iron(III) transport system ATP-binding protein